MSKIILKEETSSPATPATDKVIIYPKTNGKIYSKDDLGVETQLSNAGGDVVGQSSVNANSMAVYNGTTGKLLKDSLVYYDSINNRVGVNTTSPCSTFDTHGSIGAKCVVKTANYTANEEFGILVDATSADVTITLPSALAHEHRTYLIKKIDNSVNNVIIEGFGTETIDGELNKFLVEKNDAYTIAACNGAWHVLSQVNELPHAQLSSTVTQQPIVTTPVLITMNQNDDLSGITHSTTINSDRIIIRKKTTYFILAAAQVGKTSGTTNVNIDIWLRKNGVDVPNSNTRAGIVLSTDTQVLVSQTIVDMNKDDYFQIMLSVSSLSQGAGIIASSPSGEPAIPSIIVSIYEV